MRNAVIDDTGKVVNIIEIDADTDYVSPDGLAIFAGEDAEIGLDYIDGKFVDNRLVPIPISIPRKLTLEDVIDVLSSVQKAALQAKLGTK